MKLLAFDTSQSILSVALEVDDEIIYSDKKEPMQQAKMLLPTIQALLKSKNIKLNQLDGIVLGQGPGSFTGVRIATSAAQALGFSLKCPILPISSLEALAQHAFERLGWRALVAAVDARMNELYYGVYEIDPENGLKVTLKDQLASPTQLKIPDYFKGYGVGNAWNVYKDLISWKPIAIEAAIEPSAAALLLLAKQKMRENAWVKPEEVLPLYLRDKVAMKEKKG